MVDMSDSQVEFAARSYCGRLGLDPDERVSVPHPSGYAVALYSSRWAVIAAELKDMRIRQQAIDAGFAHG